MKLTAYATYCQYISIKTHFQQKKYDYFKYNGSIRTNPIIFEKRRDRFLFNRLSKKYDDTEMIDFFVSNFIRGNKWIGELLEDSAHDNYVSYIKKKQAFTYHFNNEISSLFSTVVDSKDLFIFYPGTYPKILAEYLSGTISLEVLAILNQYVQFIDKFDSNFEKDDIIWWNIRQLLLKILPFIQYDDNKIKEVLKRHI